MTYVCSYCESPDVCIDAWVYVNTKEIWGTYENYHCLECDGKTNIKEA